MTNKLRVGDLASADGPYVRANGTQVRALKYLEVVSVKAEANRHGEVLVVGLDSRQMVWVLESSLTLIPGQIPAYPPT